jgi:hypothetical protein
MSFKDHTTRKDQSIADVRMLITTELTYSCVAKFFVELSFRLVSTLARSNGCASQKSQKCIVKKLDFPIPR